MKKKEVRRLLLIIAIIILIMVSGMLIVNNNAKNTYKGKKWKIKEIYEDNTLVIDLGYIPTWDEKTITQKFPIVKCFNITYYSNNEVKINNNEIGEKINNTILTAYDDRSEKTYNREGTIYKLKDFPLECAIALQFDEGDDYYIYLNAYYNPKNLADFVNDLNLKENISFGTIQFEYNKIDWTGKKHIQKVDFYEVDNSIIWDLLFSDLKIENLYKRGAEVDTKFTDSNNETIGIDVEIPFLGIKDKQIFITDKGFLTTNVLGASKMFFIGEEKVRHFIDYIINNYDGYKIVYK